MKIKKLIAMALAVLMVLSLAACGNKEDKVDFTFAFVNLTQEETQSEQSAWEQTDQQDSVSIEDEDNFTVNGKKIRSGGYSSADAAIMAFDGGKVNGLYLSKSVAQYLCASRENLHCIEDTWITLYQMAAQPAQAELMGRIEAQFAQWKQDGTLDMLAQTYLSEEAMAAEPVPVYAQPAVEWPVVRVAVTGGLPPFDYVAADGTPAGFNTAMLAALSEALQIDFQPVVVETDARMLALDSGKVDVLFWVSATNEALASTDSLVYTQPYYTEHFAYVTTDEYLDLAKEIAATP